MIAIIDYGMGNLRSVQKSFEHIGAKTIVTQNPKDLFDAQKIVLPGVGAMKPAMEKLECLDLIPPIKKVVQQGKPFLGICLGLQLLFSESEEGGGVLGLGLLEGKVKKFLRLKIPHIGWNTIDIKQSPCPLFDKIENGSFTYFCHSYFVDPSRHKIKATITDYGVEFTSSVCCNNIYGVQFHPEKSQNIGLKILKNFLEIAA